MKLWLLRPVENLNKDDNPWDPWYDKCFGFVIKAESVEHARVIADGNAGDENRGEFMGKQTAATTAPWLTSHYSTCEELLLSTEVLDFMHLGKEPSVDGSGIVIADFHSA